MKNIELPKAELYSGPAHPPLVTTVKMLGVNGNIVTVQGLEMFGPSLVLNIKPYTRLNLKVEGLKLTD
jgi:tRNA (Thr-GGU) A37 N-methylase